MLAARTLRPLTALGHLGRRVNVVLRRELSRQRLRTAPRCRTNLKLSSLLRKRRQAHVAFFSCVPKWHDSKQEDPSAADDGDVKEASGFFSKERSVAKKGYNR